MSRFRLPVEVSRELANVTESRIAYIADGLRIAYIQGGGSPVSNRSMRDVVYAYAEENYARHRRASPERSSDDSWMIAVEDVNQLRKLYSQHVEHARKT